MAQRKRRRRDEKPTDRFAPSDQAPLPSGQQTPEYFSDENSADIVADASEDSFPASDPPGYSRGRAHDTDAEPEARTPRRRSRE